jgi:hypothetical protein
VDCMAESLLTQEDNASSEWTAEQIISEHLSQVFATPPRSPSSSMAPPLHKIPFPKFNAARPELFFATLETQFERYEVQLDLDKFACLSLAVDTAQLDEKACGVIANRPENAYEALKKAILENIAPADLHQVRALLLKEKLGDTKPSDFLARLTRIGTCEGLDANATKADIRDCWLRGLPAEWHNTLLTYKDLKHAAELADNLKLWSDNPLHSAVYNAATGVGAAATIPVAAVAAPIHQVAAVAANDTESRIARLEEMMLKLTTMVAQQQNGNNNSNNNNGNNNYRRGRGRGRSRSPARINNGVCYYHDKFGQNAYKCEEGCKNYNAFHAQQASNLAQGNFQGRAQ